MQYRLQEGGLDMSVYDVAVVGGGAAGTMAAVTAARRGKMVVLIERNDAIGRKMLITGKGRCNITNMASIDDFVAKFGEAGNFLRSAFTRFSNEDLIAFFRELGLEMKTERQNRVFPATDEARSVVAALRDALASAGVEVRSGIRIARIHVSGSVFSLEPAEGPAVQSRKVILATGGASYKATGSSGDGFAISRSLRHTVTDLEPGLVPLKTRETWVKDVQGLTLKNISLTFRSGKKRLASSVGELLFTHFGVSGPLILDLSAAIVGLMRSGDVSLAIDLKPGLTEAQLEKRLLSDIIAHGSKDIRNFLKLFMPVSLCPVFAAVAGIDASKKASQLTQAERRTLRDLMKALPLTIAGTLPLEEAMVTAGGVSRKEIDPRTMQSRIVPGLYFAGEIIDGAAASGGYNLQQAFSTGYLAGEEAARDA